MNRNTLIGLVAVLVLIGVGYYLYTANSSPAGSQATTTPATDNPPITIVQSAGVPAIVSDSSASPTNTTVVVTGSVRPNGLPTSYWYEFGTTSTLGSKTTVQQLGSGYETLSAPAYITQLAKNTTYYVRLSAKNAFGTVSGSIINFSTNNTPSTQGAVPSASTRSATGVSSVSATLNAQVNPHASETTYWFEYGTDSNFGSVTGYKSAGSGNALTAASAQVSSLQPSTKYYYRVNAQNRYGTVNGAMQSFTTAAPETAGTPVVTTQAATEIGATSVKFVGTINPYGVQTTYWFEYSLDTQFTSPLLKATPKLLVGAGTQTVPVAASVVGLHAGTTYYYRIVAQNALGTIRGSAISFKTN
jgi:hypothetical protein